MKKTKCILQIHVWICRWCLRAKKMDSDFIQSLQTVNIQSGKMSGTFAEIQFRLNLYFDIYKCGLKVPKTNKKKTPIYCVECRYTLKVYKSQISIEFLWYTTLITLLVMSATSSYAAVEGDTFRQITVQAVKIILQITLLCWNCSSHMLRIFQAQFMFKYLKPFKYVLLPRSGPRGERKCR